MVSSESSFSVCKDAVYHLGWLWLLGCNVNGILQHFFNLSKIFVIIDIQCAQRITLFNLRTASDFHDKANSRIDDIVLLGSAGTKHLSSRADLFGLHAMDVALLALTSTFCFTTTSFFMPSTVR